MPHHDGKAESVVENGSLHAGKAALRRKMAAVRDGIPERERLEKSRRACGHAAGWMRELGADAFLAYAPFRSELDTRPLLEWGWRRGLAVLLPFCVTKDRSLELYRVRSMDELRPGAYGVPEPDPARAERWDDLRSIGAVFVPGLAFSPDGGRLGYGGGYYDRFAARMRAAGGAARWMGLAFREQVVSVLPVEPHDVRLDGYFTEEGVHVVPAGQGG
jgi:5-formyltetrahydrofolate cyclo-ligase